MLSLILLILLLFTLIAHNSFLQEISTLVLNSTAIGANGDISTTLFYQNYAYLGLSSATPGMILQIDKSSFTVKSTLSFQTGQDLVSTGFVYKNFGYFGCDPKSGNGVVVIVDLVNFNAVGTVVLASNEVHISTSFTYLTNGYFINSPVISDSSIVQIDLTSNVRIGSVTLPGIYNGFSV